MLPRDKLDRIHSWKLFWHQRISRAHKGNNPQVAKLAVTWRHNENVYGGKSRWCRTLLKPREIGAYAAPPSVKLKRFYLSQCGLCQIKVALVHWSVYFAKPANRSKTNRLHGYICENGLRPPNGRTSSIPYFSNAQCTPTDWQSAVGDIANCRLRIGVRR